MAFNLNKNEAGGPSKKFDLSKTEAPATAAPAAHENKSKIWVFALPALLVIGAAAWFFLSKSSADANKENTSVLTNTVKPDSANTTSAVHDVAVNNADSTEQVRTENTVTANTAAATGAETGPGSGNNNNDPDRTSAGDFNNSVPVTFAKGSTSVSNIDQKLINDLIDFLQKNRTATINVNGYASSEGELVVNQQISRSRAFAFKSYMVSKGISAKRIIAAGKGIDNPISSNDTEEGRIKNRRIEISIQ